MTGDSNTPAVKPPDESNGSNANDRSWAVGLVVVLLVLCAFASLASPRRFDHTAALYIGVPAIVAISMARLPSSNSVTGSALKWLTILLVISVAVLREGFVCVIIAAPVLYTVTAMVGGLCDWISSRNKDLNKRGPDPRVLLLIPLLASLEGSHPLLTLSGTTTIVREQVIAATPGEIEAQLAKPFVIDRPVPLFARLFPPPVEIAGSGNAAGDSRWLRFVYYKWFYWNAQHGAVEFRIERPVPGLVRYVPTHDTSYIGSYLRWYRADLWLVLEPGGGTRARLEITYERGIDPAWYFGPLMRTAVGHAAEVMLDNGVVPQSLR